MRKAAKALLAAGLFAAVWPSGLRAAAGIGLEWGIGPTIQMGDFDMKFDEAFTLSWKLGDSFSVGVFRGSGQYRGEAGYSDQNPTTPPGALTYTIVASGSTSTSGLRLLTTLPMLTFISAGIDAGVMQFTADGASPRITRSDGTATAGTEFGTVDDLTTTAPLLGIVGRVGLLKASTATVTTEIAVTVGLRFVSFPDTRVFGSQEVVKFAPAQPVAIDPVGNYNNLTVGIGANLWF